MRGMYAYMIDTRTRYIHIMGVIRRLVARVRVEARPIAILSMPVASGAYWCWRALEVGPVADIRRGDFSFCDMFFAVPCCVFIGGMSALLCPIVGPLAAYDAYCRRLRRSAS